MFSGGEVDERDLKMLRTMFRKRRKGGRKKWNEEHRAETMQASEGVLGKARKLGDNLNLDDEEVVFGRYQNSILISHFL